MFCARCGTKNPENSAHCYNCGQNMAKVPERSLQNRAGSLSASCRVAVAGARRDAGHSLGRALESTNTDRARLVAGVACARR